MPSPGGGAASDEWKFVCERTRPIFFSNRRADRHQVSQRVSNASACLLFDCSRCVKFASTTMGCNPPVRRSSWIKFMFPVEHRVLTPEMGLRRFAGAEPGRGCRLVPRAPAAHEKDDEADQQHEAEAAAAISRPTDIKAAAAEHEDENNDEQEWVHAEKLTGRGRRSYGALPAERGRSRGRAAGDFSSSGYTP